MLNGLVLCVLQELYEKALIADQEHVESLVRFGVLEMKVNKIKTKTHPTNTPPHGGDP